MLLSEELQQAQDRQCDNKACFECGFLADDKECLITLSILALRTHKM